MSRKVIMTTNERRLQALNQMRASYRGVQLLRQDRTRFMQHEYYCSIQLIFHKR